MLKKRFILGIIFAGVLALLGGGRVFAVSGNTATISGGKTWEICVSTGTDYKGSAFVANITKSGFESQVVFGDFEQQGCKNVKLAAGDYTVSLNKPMGAGETSYEIIGSNKLVFTIASVLNKYFNSYGSVNYEMEGSGGTTFPTVFAIEGECTFHGNDSNITGSTCIDSDGHDWTDSKYIDTGVALFRKDDVIDNASKDFEVYFEIESYESRQEQQATYFNAKNEDASVYYPGFVIRIDGSTPSKLEITSRKGVNSSSDKKAFKYNITAGETVKVIRKDGIITYSLNGGEFKVLDDFSNFSAFFNQTAFFGASQNTDGTPMRIFKGTLKNMYIKLGKIEAPKRTVSFDANGGAGTMTPLVVNEDEATPITANSFTREDYAFNGWNTKADGSGTAYADGADITVSAAMGDTTLYAQWILVATTLKTGQDFNAALKTLAKGSSASYSDGDSLIKNLNFVDMLPSTVDQNTPKVNIALDGEIPVYAYWVANDEAIYINTEADTIYANQDSSYMFHNIQAPTSLILPDNFDTSRVTDMSWMFMYTVSLASLTLPDSFDTSNVTDMSWMFASMSVALASSASSVSLTLPDSFDTSNVTNMSNMFNNMSALTSLTLPDSFDTSSVTDMSGMFGGGTRSLTSLTLPDSFDTSSVTNMSHMFSQMSSLTSLTLPESFDTSKVTDMRGMFSYMYSLTSLTLPESFDTSKVTDMYWMFYNMSALTSLTLPDSFNTSSVTDMGYMFYGMQALTSLTLPDSFDTSKVTNMHSMFGSLQSLTSLTLPDSFDTSNVRDMSYMFTSALALTSLTLPDSFIIASRTETSNIFRGISDTATLYATDATARSLWLGVLGN